MTFRPYSPCLLRRPSGPELLGWVWRLSLLAGFGLFIYFWVSKEHRAGASGARSVHRFEVRGSVEQVIPEQSTVVVCHEAIASYMDAMTMPFRVRSSRDMAGLAPGDQISFQLSVTETESWIDHIVKSGVGQIRRSSPETGSQAGTPGKSDHPLLSYAFTNELGRPVTLRSFEGQALALTFFFTRCPIPDFCPRLSKNFAEACGKLSQSPQGPTNWHFLSVSFDPEFDTPAVLKAYAEKYRYDPAHWSFITGPKDKIAELARLSNVQVQPDNGLFLHNFRTLIIDPQSRVRMIFPTGGDLSEAIASEMLKAMCLATNRNS